ncbi:hypothetical protein CATYP_08970 [Corynebacterium atypicum]|uniref:HTH gntR-type domain-containing protein n=1 Tax=Corynebacterium atypicum TaxID=191610 RepID=A0ABN4DEC5_9CORY|nr:GntR family transcriptional regulator [Corynebacterium atypicum]AIG64670.1 hypothetical protein CATYP_08970 [Corynebacterium atypicum]
MDSRKSRPRATLRSRRPSAAALVVREIKNYIRTRNLAPGSPLPSELDLCAELGCSRSSIREAVRTLASLDIVEVRHGYGTFVSDMSLDPLVEGMVFRTICNTDRSVDHLRYVIETRKALDLAVGSQLVAAISEKSLLQLRELNAQILEKDELGESFAYEDRSFHQTLVCDLANPIIRELGDAFWRVHMEVTPILGLTTQAQAKKTIRAHQEIVAALEAGDAVAYERAVGHHYDPLFEALAAEH